jgi:hypothetical protein
LALSNFPGPKQSKAFPVPADDGRRLNEKETGPPIVPDLAQPSPQKSIGRGEFGPLDGALQNPELMTKGEDFQLQGGTASERGRAKREEGGEERAERESKEDWQPPTYQVHRSLRERQSENSNAFCWVLW